jgi:UDP-sugar transporter A1/2/3
MNPSPKWIALVALILQNSGLAILMRYTMIYVEPGVEHYLSSTAVLTAEIMKLVISICLCFIVDSNMCYKTFFNTLYSEFIINRGDWIKLMVPSILYTLQNSLQYFSMSRLSG